MLSLCLCSWEIMKMVQSSLPSMYLYRRHWPHCSKVSVREQYAATRDNLGSHSIGGFLEHFSRANHFCRYCEVDRDTFMREPHLCGTTRTAQSYQSHLQDLKISDTNSVCGIKSDSPFNQLGHFHVCQPGLPPCLGHDTV
ncbi:hypothetical protein F7725_007503 [Dissostichus mawsoni]|uniref:Uncharacterized protein n=1 Tax=Dissostichus mawsoni TaxID=36200 RepID=A0A7J5Y4P0_DISMA|nr:hypothetical protein F7725_007503 [Dissostichus mawsoni]